MIRFVHLPAKARVAAAGAIAAFALGGAGVALAANVSTPSPAAPGHPAAAATPHPEASESPDSNSQPTDTFGSQVEVQVAKCKLARPTTHGKQGIGQCVSAWVVAHNPGHTNTGH